MTKEALSDGFLSLVKIMDELREQCPWDKKQTFQSLSLLTIEETYELTDAILSNNPAAIKEELGDVLLHILFYARMAKEQQWFSLEEVMSTISKKLIHRHPHIYGDVKVVDEEEVKRNWEQLKLKEGKKGLLSGVPKSLPAMVKSYRLQEKTKQVGFEWDHIDQVWAKVEEEIAELKSNIDQGRPQDEIEDEFGDVIFSLINYGRFLKIDPEAALEKVNRKFITRFEYIEAKASKPLNDMSLEEMDALWNEAKRVKKEENL